MKNIRHQYELDILKIFGALGIVLFHYTFRGYAADNMSILSFPFLGGVFRYGYLGIYLFFVLSGYTIVLSGSQKQFKEFVLARALRLYPPFWCAVCITSLAIFISRDPRYHIGLKQFLVNLTMFNEYVGVKSVDGVYWFLFVIIRFYFLVSILILTGAVKYNEIVAGNWLIISIIIIYFNVPKIGFFLLPSYAPYFILGMISFSARNKGWNCYKRSILFISFLLSIYLIRFEIQRDNEHYNIVQSPEVVYFIIASIYLIMYWVGKNVKFLNLPRSIAICGAATYPLYLIHQIFGFMIFNKFGFIINKYLLLVSTIFLMVVLSLVIILYIDPNIRKTITRVFKRQIAQHLYGLRLSRGKRPHRSENIKFMNNSSVFDSRERSHKSKNRIRHDLLAKNS